MTKLSGFARTLPASWATCPIYAKGVKLPSGREAGGKSPLGSTHHEHWSPEDTALELEKNPDTFKAVGVFTGPRSGGLVILDVDDNLSALKKKWNKDLNSTVVVESPKRNAAKYLFVVPKELWGDVEDVSLSASGEGWEVLWGRQGLVGGAYYSGGEYVLKGDVNEVAKAPGWLLAHMKNSYKQKNNPSKNARRDTRWSTRSREELIAIIENCLSVIKPQGRGSEDQWFRIGCMIHSELPNEHGLNLWREWSLRDDEYSDDWSNGADPCLERWEAGFKANGGLGIGSLIQLADHYDPDRRRFQRDPTVGKTIDEVMQIPLAIRGVQLTYEETIEKAKSFSKERNTAKRDFQYNSLALQAGYRDPLQIEKMLVDHAAYEGDKGLITADELAKLKVEREFLIPDVLPHPSVVLLYGSGGDGKSMAAWTLAKHIATGSPFLVRGKHLPVKKGPVMLLNGDQPQMQLLEQLEQIDFPLDKNTFIKSDFAIQQYNQFKEYMDEIKPKLVVIDSLIGCAGGRAFDENKSEFAAPLYWLTRNNGVMFPATTIVIIHHANKQGGFRGTSAIRDAVDETWRLSKPSKEQIEKKAASGHSRIITIEKSRSGRSGTALLMQMEDDLGFSVSDFTPEIDQSNGSPTRIIERVLNRLRVIYPRTATRSDLVEDPIVGGNSAAIRKALQRLCVRGLIEVVGNAPAADGKNRCDIYKAVLACGEVQKTCPTLKEPSDTNESGVGHRVGQTPDPLGASQPELQECSQGGTTFEKTEPCPTLNLSDTNETAKVGQDFQYPPARDDERTPEQLITTKNNAWELWD